MMPVIGECSNGTDKNLEGALNKIDSRMKDLAFKYPEMKWQMVSSGFRGTKYFIEFPIVQN